MSAAMSIAEQQAIEAAWRARCDFVVALQYAERDELIIVEGEGGRPCWVNPYQLLLWGGDHA